MKRAAKPAVESAKPAVESAKPAVESAKPAVESMTGFGEARAKFGGTTVSCRARSLNHRFLDLKLRLPRADLVGLDMAARKRVAEIFKRGAIELSVTAELGRESADSLVNTKLAQSYRTALNGLAKKLKSKPVTLEALLRLPGVIGASSQDEALSEIAEADLLSKVIEPALAALRVSRLDEGRKLTTHLVSLIDEIDGHLHKIAALEEPEKERARETITERAHETLKLLSSIASGHSYNEEFSQRVREEAVFWVERRDFEEERVRLGMHLKTFRELLTGSTEASGRKLEFIHQEMLRETNTMGTKAQSPAITSLTIEIKTVLERLKEQLANVT